MDTKHEEMTAAEHAERAQSQGQTVAEYCRQTGLSVHVLYGARRELKEKGLLPGAPKQRLARRKTGKFITVSVTEAAPAGCVPGAPSGRLGDRVCHLAGPEVDEGPHGRTNMMRPWGEDLKIYLHRAAD